MCGIWSRQYLMYCPPVYCQLSITDVEGMRGHFFVTKTVFSLFSVGHVMAAAGVSAGCCCGGHRGHAADIIPR